MKHEFETSILCAESEFPTYPRPSTARIASNTVQRNLNWNFLDGSTLAGTNYASTYDSAHSGHSKQSLTLDLPVENDTSQESSSQSTTTKSIKMSSANSNPNQLSAVGSTSHARQGNSSAGGGGGSRNISAGTNRNNNDSGGNASTFCLGLYGWRKKCLYLLILSLMILIVVNLALTLWILKVMEFTTDGMGQLKIVPGGLQLSGQALFLDLLRASTIRSRHGQPITIESSKNFSINTRDYEGRVDNQLFLGHDKLEVMAHHFKILDTHGNVLFAADRNEIVIGANALRVDGDGGIIFRESVQSPLIRAEPGKELKLESPTRSLLMNAGQDILIKSGAGNIDASCLNDIRINSRGDGSIRLDSANILMPNLKIVPSPVSSASASIHEQQQQQQQQQPQPHHQHKVYQLCACSNGKLFLAMSHSICAGDESTVCR